MFVCFATQHCVLAGLFCAASPDIPFGARLAAVLLLVVVVVVVGPVGTLYSPALLLSVADIC